MVPVPGALRDRAGVAVRPARTAAALLAALALGCQTTGARGGEGSSWPRQNLNLASSRSQASSGIDRRDVGKLHIAWRFRFRAAPGPSGDFTATPVVAGGAVYLQDMASTVFALDETTGRLLWRHRFVYAANPGPNGLAILDGRVIGATSTNAFALSAATGKVLWDRRLVTLGDPVIDIAPQVSAGIVYTSTIGLPPGGKGFLYALDAATGHVRWRLSTIEGAWKVPSEAGGGGAWYAPSIAGGLVYWGTANPYPYGGTRKHPNGGAYAGPALYTDSLLVVDARSGKLRWYDQVAPHDVRDHDFQLPPILFASGGANLVVGSGKGGVVIAWNRATHRRVWQTPVGLHRNDHGPLPARRVPVCPGLLGGVETPMALAGGRLFVPVVDLCVPGSASGYEPLEHVDVSKGKGELVALDAATGKPIWRVSLPQPDFGCATATGGVVFTSTLDGTLYAFGARDGARLWTTRAGAGINACPAIAGGMLFVGAGVRRAKADVLELDAFSP
jgi:alcohol dehydrogenase (cytochrome c)